MSGVRVASLHRYPVKGLSPEPMDEARLTVGDYVPGDRLYAIENGPSGFDPAAPRHQPKIKFLMLMRNERLATLRTRYLDAATTLSIREGDAERVRADVRTEAGRASVRAFFERFMPAELRGPPGILAAPDGFRFTDSRTGYVSLINLASVAALEERIGHPVDPLRFRANIAIDGLPPWREFDWVGRTIGIGDDVRLKVTKRIVRCAATEVDPVSGLRDLPVVRTLDRAFGHTDCGVYAEVVRAGTIRAGDTIAANSSEMQPALPF